MGYHSFCLVYGRCHDAGADMNRSGPVQPCRCQPLHHHRGGHLYQRCFLSGAWALTRLII